MTEAQVRAAAAAIANARAGRRGVPPIVNVLELLERTLPKLYREVIEDARAALEAAHVDRVATALEESVKLQSHYAELLNMYDGGQRMPFASAQEWLDRLDTLKAER